MRVNQPPARWRGGRPGGRHAPSRRRWLQPPCRSCPREGDGRGQDGLPGGLPGAALNPLAWPEESSPEDRHQRRQQRQAAQQHHRDRDGDRGTQRPEEVERREDHDGRGCDHGRGARGDGSAHLHQSLFERGSRSQAAAQHLTVAGDQKEAVVGRPPPWACASHTRVSQGRSASDAAETRPQSAAPINELIAVAS
jgi:hypothetical protein